MEIIVDTREKPEHRWNFSRSEIVTNLVHKKLDTGDYSISGMEDIFCIERKRNVSEIATNIVEKRFKDVLQRLGDYKYKYILCEFDVSNIVDFPIGSGIPRSKQRFIKIKPPFIFSCLSKIQVDYGIPIIYCGNASNAEIIAENIFKRIIQITTGDKA